MPGSSLWLLPPPSHPLTAILTTLIKSTLPSHFPLESSSQSPRVAPHYFAAHVTLTSGIDPVLYGDDPQGWVEREVGGVWDGYQGKKKRGTVGGKGGGEGVQGGEREGGEEVRGGVKIRFERVESQDVFYRRCFVKVRFEEEGVRELAGLARARGVIGEGVEVGDDGELKFGEETEKWLEDWRREFGPHVSLMYGDKPIADEAMKKITELVQEAGVKLAGEQSEGKRWDGWEGGVIWLVPTDKPISEWKPIATREL